MSDEQIAELAALARTYRDAVADLDLEGQPFAAVALIYRANERVDELLAEEA